MKKLQILVLLLLKSYSVYTQNQEWVVYTANLVRSYSNDNILSIEINGSENKFISKSTGLDKFLNPNSILNNPYYSSVLPNNFILSLALDGIGNIWIGTYAGLTKFDGVNWTTYNTSNSSLPSNIIYSIAIDRKGIKWIGTTAGLAKYEGQKWTVYNSSNSRLPDNTIYSLAIDRNGNKWVGTLAGLTKYDGRKWTVFKKSNSGLPNNNVTSIAIDKKGNKWIGTFEGLAKFDNKKWIVFKTSNSGLPYNDIYSISLDGDNNIIIETWGGGLAKYNGSTWTRYKTSNSGLPNNNVTSFAIDKKGNKWIGTLAGLTKFDGKKWNIFNTKNSRLPDNKVYSLIMDNNENLWIGTENGLAVYKKGGIITLPAELITFYSEIKQSNVCLVWQGTTQVNYYGYEIEKRINNSEWEKIGFVPGYESNYLPNSYSFVDKHPKNGKNFYRLKQINFNRTYKYSRIIEAFVDLPISFSCEQIINNSFNSNSSLRLSLPKKINIKLSLHNVFGREVTTLVNQEFEPGYHEISFSESKLLGGIYFYRIQSGNFIYTKKMIL